MACRGDIDVLDRPAVTFRCRHTWIRLPRAACPNQGGLSGSPLPHRSLEHFFVHIPGESKHSHVCRDRPSFLVVRNASSSPVQEVDLIGQPLEAKL